MVTLQWNWTAVYGSFLGWTTADCPDEEQLKKLGDDMSNAIKEVHGKKYESQKSIGLYKTTGTASDWYVHAYIIWTW